MNKRTEINKIKIYRCKVCGRTWEDHRRVLIFELSRYDIHGFVCDTCCGV